MKKALKIMAIILAFALIGVVLFFANGFVGNPVSKMLSERTAEEFLEENFADTDFEITEVAYNFKTGGYWADVVSPSSEDSYFTIYLRGNGKYAYDTYDNVTDGYNTYSRIDREYRDVVENVLDAEDFPYDVWIAYGGIAMIDIYELGSDEVYGVKLSELVLDKEYDINAMGREYGEITLYIEDEEVTEERMAEILLDVTKILDERNVTFKIIDFVLEKPRVDEEYQGANSPSIRLEDFLYSDIYEGGLTERIIENNHLIEARYAYEDAKMEIEDLYIGKAMDYMVSDEFPYEEWGGGASVIFSDGEGYGLAQENGKFTEISEEEIAEKYGEIDIYIETEDVSLEEMTEILLNIKGGFDKAGIKFHWINLRIQNEDETNSLTVEGFLYSDIYEEGLEERVEDSLI